MLERPCHTRHALISRPRLTHPSKYYKVMTYLPTHFTKGMPLLLLTLTTRMPFLYMHAKSTGSSCNMAVAKAAQARRRRARDPQRPVQHYYDLGLFSSSLQNSNETFCMLNRQRELTLPRLTAAPTATSCAYC